MEEKATINPHPDVAISGAAVDASVPSSLLSPVEPPAKKGWRFWAIFGAICVTAMLAAVESSVTSTALPTIVHELDAGPLYIWVVNAYFLTR
jgi:MFS family permease